MSLFTKGNAKLPKNVLCWSILAGKEGCNRECYGCYAVKIQNRFLNVRAAWSRNLAISKANNFVDIVNEELKGHEGKIVRIHVAGDFYSGEYISKWMSIIESNPNIYFYGYTKNKEALVLNKLSNCNIISSVVPVSLGTAGLNYCKDTKVFEDAGIFVCPDVDRGPKKICMVECFACLYLNSVAFKKH